MAVTSPASPSSVSANERSTRPVYSIRFAKTKEEILAALRLRFEVFNLELNEGLASSHATGLDEDEFDEV